MADAKPVIRAPEPGEFPASWGQELGDYTSLLRDVLTQRAGTTGGQVGGKLREYLGYATLLAPMIAMVRGGKYSGPPLDPTDPGLLDKARGVFRYIARQYAPRQTGFTKQAGKTVEVDPATRRDLEETAIESFLKHVPKFTEDSKLMARQAEDPEAFRKWLFPKLRRDTAREAARIGRPVEVPQELIQSRGKIDRVINEFYVKYGIEPPDKFIAKRARIPLEQVQAIRRGLDRPQRLSLDQPMGGSEVDESSAQRLHETLGGTGPQAGVETGSRTKLDDLLAKEARGVNESLFYRALRQLTPEHRDLLLARTEGTQAEVADKMGIRRTTLAMREKSAKQSLSDLIDKLRKVGTDPGRNKLREAPASYLGYQEGVAGKPGFRLYNLTQDVPGHSKGSTVSENTLRQLGYDIPLPPIGGGSQSPLTPAVFDRMELKPY